MKSGDEEQKLSQLTAYRSQDFANKSQKSAQNEEKKIEIQHRNFDNSLGILSQKRKSNFAKLESDIDKFLQNTYDRY